jgi:hypothetical protein
MSVKSSKNKLKSHIDWKKLRQEMIPTWGHFKSVPATSNQAP